MDTVRDLADGLLGGLAYGGLGLLLLALGYLAVDVVTPGRLSHLIYAERNANAAIVVSAGLIGIAAIVTTAIVTSADALGEGLANVAGYGALGIVLQMVAFVVLDRLTPGDLGVLVTDPERHPAVWVTAAMHLAVGAIVAAAIS